MQAWFEAKMLNEEVPIRERPEEQFLTIREKLLDEKPFSKYLQEPLLEAHQQESKTSNGEILPSEKSVLKTLKHHGNNKICRDFLKGICMRGFNYKYAHANVAKDASFHTVAETSRNSLIL